MNRVQTPSFSLPGPRHSLSSVHTPASPEEELHTDPRSEAGRNGMLVSRGRLPSHLGSLTEHLEMKGEYLKIWKPIPGKPVEMRRLSNHKYFIFSSCLASQNLTGHKSEGPGRIILMDMEVIGSCYWSRNNYVRQTSKNNPFSFSQS